MEFHLYSKPQESETREEKLPKVQMDQIHVSNYYIRKYFTCCRKDTKSFPFRVFPCTIFGFMMDATSCFNCSRRFTYNGSSSLSSISHNFVLCRWGCINKINIHMIYRHTQYKPKASTFIGTIENKNGTNIKHTKVLLQSSWQFKWLRNAREAS